MLPRGSESTAMPSHVAIANEHIAGCSSASSDSVFALTSPQVGGSEVSTLLDLDIEPTTTLAPTRCLQSKTHLQPALWSQIIADWWLLELAAALTSLAAMTSMFGVLLAYDRKPVPPLVRGVTLNAIISFLATISRTSIMLCVGTALSQFKWLWFERKRNLLDLQIIEDASRGPMGSLLMLLNLRGGVQAYLAAFVTIGTLGFDPLVQQLLTVHTEKLPVPSSSASINAARNFPYAAYNAFDSAQTNAVLAATIEAINKTSPLEACLLEPDCLSGNCIWPSYHSLDICTKCQDVTKTTTVRNLSPTAYDSSGLVTNSVIFDNKTDSYSNFTWEIAPANGNMVRIGSTIKFIGFIQQNLTGPSQALLNGTYVHKIVWPLNGAIFSNDPEVSLPSFRNWMPQAFAGVDKPVLALGYAELSIDRTTLKPVLNRTMECAITYCVNEYNTTVIQNNLLSDVIATHYGTGDARNKTWATEVNGTMFDVGIATFYGSGIDALARMVQGQSVHTFSVSYDHTDNQIHGAGNYTVLDRNYTAEQWKGIDLANNFTMLLERAVSVVSGTLRQNGSVKVLGLGFITKAFVSVRWPWIAFPLTIILSGLVAFGLTVWQTRRQRVPLWKASLLPLIYRYELDSDDGSDDHSVNDRRSQYQPTPKTQRICVRGRTSLQVWTSSTVLVSDLELRARSSPTILTQSKFEPGDWVLRSTSKKQERKYRCDPWDL